MSRILALKTLKSKNACIEQVELFKKLFGDSVEITPELCIKHANDFDFHWAARKILSNAAYKKYREEKNAAWDKYHAEENAVWEKYNAKRNAAYDKYYAETKTASDKYRAEENAAWNIFSAERNSALDKYRAERAAAFADAYINDVE